MKILFGAHCNNQKGLSLVEVLVAVGLIGGIAVSLMQSRDVLNTNRRVLNQRMDENNILRSIHMVLNDKRSCENTFARPGFSVDPRNLGQEFTEIRDENNNVIYSRNMVLGRGGGSPVEITNMRISHFSQQLPATSTEPVFWNSQNQATVTIRLQRVSDLDLVGGGIATPGTQNSISRRFQVLVRIDGSGAITDCNTDEDFMDDIYCDQLSGTYDADGTCRSISLSPQGNDIPLESIDDVAIRVDRSARVDGVTAITEKLELGLPATFFTSPSSSPTDQGIHARAGTYISDYLLNLTTQIPAHTPLDAINMQQVGNIHVPNRVTIGAGAAAAGGLYVQGNIFAPRIKLFGMEELVHASTQAADHPGILEDHAASVGYVARRITNVLTEITGGLDGSFETVLADILTNAPSQPQGALALLRYVCGQTRVIGANGVAVTGVFTVTGGVPRCEINFVHRMHNCSIDPAAPNPICAQIMANEIFIGPNSRSNWNQLIVY